MATGLVFALCCLADGFVLRTAWTGRAIEPGQFRRGYFERLGAELCLAVDTAIRPDMIPSFVLEDGGLLAVPPGMTAVVPLRVGTDYTLASQSPLAPYVVIAGEAPVAPAARHLELQPGEARLVGGRTPAIEEDRLALVAWDPTRPWSEDAARLAELRDACTDHGSAPVLNAQVAGNRLELRLGRCTLSEPLLPVPQLAALAGPEWMTVSRQPAWNAERWIVWPLLCVIVAKVAAIWWGLGAVSAVATSAVLAAAALPMPVPAMLTWPLMLIVGIAAVTLRALVWVARRIPPRRRAPAAFAVLAVAGAAVVLNAIQPTQAPEIRRSRSDQDQDQPDSCAVLGYSTVKGEGLRGQQGGIRSFLDHDCQQCRHRTAGIFAGGETLAWLRDNYCGSPPSFGADGHVYVLGGANDDFLWGVLSIARLFIIGQQGVTPWRRNQVSAAAASRAQIDAQTSALADLIRCARSRGAQLLFLHDFLATDLSGGRGDDRAAMLARRQAVVETAGGSFADLLSVFANEVGISWFNDYVHLSLVAHERVADLACRRSLTPPHRAVTSDAQ